MKSPSVDDAPQHRPSRQAIISTTLVVAISAITVLGAFLLATLDLSPNTVVPTESMPTNGVPRGMDAATPELDTAEPAPTPEPAATPISSPAASPTPDT